MIEINKNKLKEIVESILGNKKGILAADERSTSLDKKFENFNIKNSYENRSKFREILFTSFGLEKYIGGAILNEETFENKNFNNKLLTEILKEKGILIGVKLDLGLKEFETNEKISVGLEDLENRIKKFPSASFTKWRSLFFIDKNLPSESCIKSNIDVLVKYAKIAQLNNKVPIVEPEIFYEGNYSLEEMKEVAFKIYNKLFTELKNQEVFLPGIILKISFLTPGKNSNEIYEESGVAIDNLEVLTKSVPSETRGIVFLSGGHSPDESIKLLTAINYSTNSSKNSLENCLNNRFYSYSFGRALTDPFLAVWKGKDENIEAAQLEFLDVCCKAQNALKKNFE